MKLAISSTGKDLDAELDPRFGRCSYFIIVDPETMQFEFIDNTSIMAPGGAGIAAAQLIAGKGAGVVLTGSCGPNAFEALAAAGVHAITGLSGKIRDVIEKYKSGELKISLQPNTASHSGMGTVQSGGFGGNPGSGGKGMGRGMGRRGMGPGTCRNI